jgi:hypothetical protein
MVGCALGPSRLWLTLGGGIVNEAYYPRVDFPQIRDLGFIIADNDGFWIELKRMGSHMLQLAAPGTLAGSGLNLHFARILTNSLVCGQKLDFTYQNLGSWIWAECVYSITVIDRPQ